MTLQYGQYLKKINGNLKKETSFKRSKLDDLSSHGGFLQLKMNLSILQGL